MGYLREKEVEEEKEIEIETDTRARKRANNAHACTRASSGSRWFTVTHRSSIKNRPKPKKPTETEFNRPKANESKLKQT